MICENAPHVSENASMEQETTGGNGENGGNHFLCSLRCLLLHDGITITGDENTVATDQIPIISRFRLDTGPAFGLE